jgi:Uncharacterized conserved protein (DUF2190)
MAQYTPVYAGGTAPWTLQASVTVTGGRLVESTGDGTVGPAGAASVKVLGVAAHDAASGAKVAVWPLAGLTHRVTGTGSISAGDNLAAGAAGVVAVIAAGTFGQLVGVASSPAADTFTVEFVGR